LDDGKKKIAATGELHRKRTELLIPSDADMVSGRAKLHPFDPWDTKELLSEAESIKDKHPSKDAAIKALREARKHQQLVTLLEALGLDPKDQSAGWKAFLSLAEIHYNVGRLVHRPSRKKYEHEWTKKDEYELLYWVGKLVKEDGLSERKAVNAIADEQVFPYHERQIRERHAGTPSKIAQRTALWRQYQRLKPMENSIRKSQSLERALGIMETEFESYLSSLEIEAIWEPPPHNSRTTAPAKTHRGRTPGKSVRRH
jgi:hypothetical protein